MDVMYAGFAGRKNQPQNLPVQLSSLLAFWAILSFKQRINQLISDSRSIHSISSRLDSNSIFIQIRNWETKIIVIPF